MNKKIFAVFICAILCFAVALPVFATELDAPATELDTSAADNFFSDMLVNISSKLSMIPSAVILAASLIICFAGYRLSKISLGIGGFFVGLIIVDKIISFIGVSEDTLSLILRYVAAVLIGVALTGLACKFLKLGAFLLAAFAGYMLSSALAISGTAVALITLICGVCAIIFFRCAVIIASATAGGMMAGASLVALIPFELPIPYAHIILGAIIVLVGISLQFSISKRKRK